MKSETSTLEMRRCILLLPDHSQDDDLRRSERQDWKDKVGGSLGLKDKREDEEMDQYFSWSTN